MLTTLLNIFRVPELRKKILFTLFLLVVYRIGFYVMLPGVDGEALAAGVKNSTNSPLGALSNYLSLFSGGNLSQSTIFGLGIMPYISASIIFQLLGTVLPSLEKLQKEGEPGRRKINEWTRYATVALCAIQAVFWLFFLSKETTERPHGYLLLDTFQHHYLGFWVMGLTAMTAGSVFLMWLGEQIDEFGIGNGVSLIIMAGIVSRMIPAIGDVAKDVNFHVNAGPDSIGAGKLLFLIASFVFVVAGAIVITQAQRRIVIQQAKHMRGRRVYGGQKQYLPLRVNHGGVMPIIFASSLMLFPNMIIGWVDAHTHTTWIHIVHDWFAPGEYLYEILYVGMIFFFSYFWNTVQFQPKELANQLRDYGSFIPGLRPGKRTAEYLENVMTRITYVGAAFLAVIAVVPTLVAKNMHISPQVTQFLGGTGLLIVIAVMLDLINRIEANLIMRNYGGFLEGGSNGAKRRPNRPTPTVTGPAADKNAPAFDRKSPKGLPT